MSNKIKYIKNYIRCKIFKYTNWKSDWQGEFIKKIMTQGTKIFPKCQVHTKKKKKNTTIYCVQGIRNSLQIMI